MSPSYAEMLEAARDKAVCTECGLPAILAPSGTPNGVGSFFHLNYPRGCIYALGKLSMMMLKVLVELLLELKKPTGNLLPLLRKGE